MELVTSAVNATLKDISFESLFLLFPINFSWVDEKGYLLGCNQNLLDLFNISDFKEVIGEHTTKFVSEKCWLNTKKVIKEGKSLSFEETHLRYDGKELSFLSVKSPIKSDKGDIIGAVIIGIDVTDRKLMHMNLIKYNERKEQQDLMDIQQELTLLLHKINLLFYK